MGRRELRIGMPVYMGSREADWRDVLTQLQKLERDNRRWKHVGAASLLVIIAVLLMGQAWPTVGKVVETQRIVLRDMNGAIRAELTTERDSARLVLFDRNGARKAELHEWGVHFAGGELGGADLNVFLGPRLELRDQAGNAVHLSAVLESASLTLSGKDYKPYLEMTTGNGKVPRLRISDMAGRARAALALLPSDEQPAFLMWDKDDQIRATLGIGRNGPGITFSDAKQTRRAHLGVTAGASVLGLYDQDGKSRAGMFVVPDGRPGVVLADKNETPFWSAP